MSQFFLETPGGGTPMIQFDLPDSNSVTPTAGGVVTFTESAGIDITQGGANTVNFAFDITEVGTIADTFTADSGSAQPSANNLNILGGSGVSTSGSGSTITISLDGGSTAIDSLITDVAGPVAPDGSGNVTVTGSSIFSDGTTANTLTLNVEATSNTFLYGQGADTNVAELGPLTDGQLIIGATGGAPAAGTLTAGTGITITNGTNSITIDASTAVPTTFTADSGSATAASNNLNVFTSSNDGINTSGSGSTITITTADDLAAVEALSGTGHAVRTAADTWALRTQTGSTSVKVTDGDGVSGNPTYSWEDRMFLMPGQTINLGISLSSGTFSVTGADGTALSASNPGWVAVPSAVTPGQIIAHQVTADQSFDDSSAGGGSNIVDNLFGLTSGDDWGANDIPFWIYAVAKSDDSAVQFMISRNPGKQSSPVASKIGDTAAAGTSAQSQFFALGSITEADYASQPCVVVGCFRMRFTQPGGADDWTVQTLADQDGIGKFFEGFCFNMPTGVFGASSGTFLKPNGGTAPVFSTNTFTYCVDLDSKVRYQLFLTGDGGTDGSGAVQVNIACPYNANTNTDLGFVRIITPSFTVGHSLSVNTTGNVMTPVSVVDGTVAQNSDFTNGSRQISGNSFYLIRDDGS